MTRILAIDPGHKESGYALIDGETRRPLHVGKLENGTLRGYLLTGRMPADAAAIEMVASYGMAVGAEVFETCVWIGRFMEVAPAHLQSVYRLDVKLHHCHNSRAKDTNIVRALVDRFTPGEPNYGKGTKANPGWFHGFAADVWQAYALAVLVADRLEMVA